MTTITKESLDAIRDSAEEALRLRDEYETVVYVQPHDAIALCSIARIFVEKTYSSLPTESLVNIIDAAKNAGTVEDIADLSVETIVNIATELLTLREETSDSEAHAMVDYRRIAELDAENARLRDKLRQLENVEKGINMFYVYWTYENISGIRVGKVANRIWEGDEPFINHDALAGSTSVWMVPPLTWDCD